jgi:hypothetical protein
LPIRTWFRVAAALVSILAVSVTAISVGLPHLAPLQRAKTVLVRQLSDSLGVPCELQSVEVTSSGNVRLRGVQLAFESADAQALVEIGDVTVDFSLWRLFRTQAVAESIRAVRVHSPRITLHGLASDLLALVSATQARSDEMPPLEFPIRISDLKVTWGTETWSERLLTLESVSPRGLRVFLRQSELDLNALPFPLHVRGQGDVVDASRLERLALQVVTPAGRADLTGHGDVAGLTLAVKGSFEGEPLQQILPWWALSGTGQFEGHLWVDADGISVQQGVLRSDQSEAVYTWAGRFDRVTGYLDSQVESDRLPTEEVLAWARFAWPWEGQVSGRLRIHGPVDRLVYEISVAGGQGRAWGQSYTDLTADVEIVEGVTVIDRAKVAVAGGQLTARGHVGAGAVDLLLTPQGIRIGELPWDLLGGTFSETAVEAALRVRGPLAAPKIGGTFAVPSVAVRGRIQADYSTDPTKTLAGDVEFQGVLSDIPFVAGLTGNGWGQEWNLDSLSFSAREGQARLQGSLTPDGVCIAGHWSELPLALLGIADIDGTISGTVDVKANQGQAEGSLRWESPELILGGSPVTQAAGRVVLRGGRMHLEDWRASASGRPLQLEGSVPLFPGMASFLGFRESEAVDLRIGVPSGPLTPLLVWLPFFPSGRSWGSLMREAGAHGHLQLHVTGDFDDLAINGEANIEKAEIPLPEPWGNLEDVQAKVLFEGNRLRLETISAKALGGRLNAVGELTWQGVEEPQVQATITGDLRPRVSGIEAEGALRLRVEGPVNDPSITGQLVLRKGTLDMGSLQTAGSTGPGMIDPRLDIDVQVNQLRVRLGSLLDVPVKGRLRATGRVSGPELAGQLAADRGRLNYLGTNFVLEEAVAEFVPSRGVFPRISLWGTTWIGRTTVALQLSGILPHLGARLTSQPPMSQQEILALLEWPGQLARMNSGNMDLMEMLQQGMAMSLVGGVEDAVRQSLGLDDFRLEPDLSQRRIRLSVGKTLLPRIYLTYEQSLFSEPQGELTLEYDLDDGWRLSVGVRNDGELRLGVKARTRF